MLKRNSERPKWKNTLQRRVTGSFRKQVLKQMVDYSWAGPIPDSFDYSATTMETCAPTAGGPSLRRRSMPAIDRPVVKPKTRKSLVGVIKDTDLQQKIDHEIKMREGTTKLLAAAKNPSQKLEASKNLITTNSRIINYMRELQRRTTAEVMGKTLCVEGNQTPCKSQVSVSDIRIPLMWKDTDHFKNKGDHRRYAVFCLVKTGSEIYDTSLISNVDRSMTDISFDDVIVFDNVPCNFECTLEVYCHKLHEDLTIASTPKKIRKKFNDFSGSVGRNVGKRLSGLSDADIIGNMVLGPKFDLVTTSTLSLSDADDTVRTYDLTMEPTADGNIYELPFFGHYCCRLAVLPHCLTRPAMTGHLNLLVDRERNKQKRYWCVLKNLELACFASPQDEKTARPHLCIPVTKNTQVSDADPRIFQNPHTFHVTTKTDISVSDHVLSADSKHDFENWWDGFQQHLLDQAAWKHATEQMMLVQKASPLNLPLFLRKSSLYDDTPIEDPEHTCDPLGNSIEDTELSQMICSLMHEAQQIRGDGK
ncbi:rhotekin-2 isoform X2 [Octopus sinensis]|uniref:Rhotekin-2 isoform X2 n=1 Tax=Octopus sinensis TaxID=2607531 RepID=A0A7E6FC37_9MOLL|nr:rhotekin-2 isoform X2 [Octopus sinensis]